MKKPKGPKDPRGSHVRLYWDILDSNAWRSLSAVDQRAYIAMHRQLLSFNNGDISLPISYARLHGISNESSLAKSLRALMAVGLIAITHKEAHRRDGSRLPNLYRFTDYSVHSMPTKGIEACPATNEWRGVTTKAMGKALIRKAEEENAARWAVIQAERARKKQEKEGAPK